MVWVVVSVAGLVIETVVIVVLGLAATGTDEDAVGAGDRPRPVVRGWASVVAGTAEQDGPTAPVREMTAERRGLLTPGA